MRRKIAMLLTTVMMVTSLQVPGWAEEVVESDEVSQENIYSESLGVMTSGDYNYTVLQDGTAEINMYKGSDTKVTVPSVIDGYSVTSISDGAFRDCRGLTEITIPNSVTSIGYGAFRDCRDLTEITIPNSVTSIGYGAFQSCGSLTKITIPNSVTSIGNDAFEFCSGMIEITIPNSVTSIGDRAFRGCKKLTEITIPNSVTSIGDWAFDDCSGLIEITIPNSVTSIGDGAFRGCKKLTEITIPNSVTSIGDGAFYGCEKLTEITIPNSVTSIGNDAFYHCWSLTKITIPNSVTSIGNDAFYHCWSLTKITIPNSVTSIGYEAFRNCMGLTEITIPDSVTSIGDGAFEACSSLTEITVDENNQVYDSRDNCNAIIKTSTNKLISGCMNTSIPNSVTSIGDYAFDGCFRLIEITIPNSVTSIGDGAFHACSGLTEITIPNSVTSICVWAFYGCSGLTEITIPNSVTSISGSAFNNCSSLTEITVDENNQVYDSRDNCNAIIKTSTNKLISGCMNTSIPNSVTSIGYRAFRDCHNLTEITIPNSVTTIDYEAFYGCKSLTVCVYKDSYAHEYVVNERIPYKIIEGGSSDKPSPMPTPTTPPTISTISKKDIYENYPVSLVASTNSRYLWNGLIESMSEMSSDYIDKNTGWFSASSLKYTMKNAGYGDLKLIFEVASGNDWTLSEVSDSVTQDLLLELSQYDDAVDSVRTKLQKHVKDFEKVSKFLIDCSDANDERDTFIALFSAASHMSEGDVKDLYMTIGKSKEFEDVKKSFKAIDKTITVCDVISLAYEEYYINQTVVTTLDKYIEGDGYLKTSLKKHSSPLSTRILTNVALDFCKNELLEKKILGALADAGIVKLGTYIAAEYYGVGGYASSGVSLAIAKLLFYFGSYLIPCNDTEEILKCECAITNARQLSGALHKERWNAMMLKNANGDLSKLQEYMDDDEFLYESGLVALDAAYKRLESLYSDSKKNKEKFEVFKKEYEATRPLLSYEKNLIECKQNYMTVWTNTVKNNSISNDYSILADSVDTEKYELTGVEFAYNDSAFMLVVPDTVDDHIVSGIGDSLFKNCTLMEGVTLPESIVSIGKDAFYGCSNLKFVRMENGVKSIGSNAFAECSDMSTITLPQSVTYIADDAFGSNTSISICGEKGSYAEEYAKNHGFDFVENDKEVESISIASMPAKLDYSVDEIFDSNGLKLNVSYADGTSEIVDDGYYISLGDRVIGENEAEVSYHGKVTTFTYNIVASECKYTISYENTEGLKIKENFVGSAKTGEILHLVAPQIKDYTPIISQQDVTIGVNNDFVFVYELDSDNIIPLKQSVGNTLIVSDIAKIDINNVDTSKLLVKGKSGTYDASTGTFKAIKKGTAKLYYLDGKKKVVVCTIKVEMPKLKANLKMKAGKTKKLKLTGTKRTDAIWSSSDEGVASMSGGIVSAKKAGECDIIAKIGKHEWKCHVVVK